MSKKPPDPEARTRALSEEECARRGWLLEHTSWRAKFPGEKFFRKFDLFGWVDMLATPDDRAVLRGVADYDRWGQPPLTFAIQFTDSTSVSKRKRKILESPLLPFVGQMGWIVLVWGWSKEGSLREVRVDP